MTVTQASKLSRRALAEMLIVNEAKKGNHWVYNGPKNWRKDEILSELVERGYIG